MVGKLEVPNQMFPCHHGDKNRFAKTRGQREILQTKITPSLVLCRITCGENLSVKQQFLCRAAWLNCGSINFNNVLGQALKWDLSFKRALAFIMEEETKHFH